MFSRTVLLCAVALVATASGCGGGEGATVVASFYPLAFAAEEVTGASVRVNDLTPPGAEPHDLELTARDVARVRDARLVLFVGQGFQPAVEDALERRTGPSLDVLDAARPVRSGGALDPHVWLDPIRYAAVARAIARELGDPAPAAADRFVARLRALDVRYRSSLARCARRTLVTSHGAFGYLAARYGLRQVPLLGLAPETEPTPRELARLVRSVRESGATTVFTERLASPALADTISRETGVVTAVLDPLEGLTSSERDAGADYFDVMGENLDTLRKALGCP
jgi:zinc transport system substrate-binding protein